MANRFPLVVDSSALQIKEIPANDNLDLANSSIVNVVNITASGNVSVGGTLTYEDVENIDSVGLITARTGIKIGPSAGVGGTFSANGSYITAGIITAGSFNGSLAASNLTGALPAIDGSALTGVISGVGIKTSGGNVGFGVTFFDFRGSGVGEITAPSAGISTINITGGGGGGGSGISTAAATVTNGNTTLLNLATAQDHKITCTGTVTISCTGGTEGDSHTVRIINSGISTVGFSTYFLFPSGNTPSLPTGSGDISLISFTVHRGGAAGISTQLHAGASLNFS